MKKKLHFLSVLLVAMLLIPWQLSAQNLLDENFDNLTSGVPEGWSVEGSTSPSYHWSYYSYNGWDNTVCLRFNGCMSNKTTSILKSPVIDLTKTTKDMMLTFYLYDADEDDIKVYISTDGGTTYEDNLLLECDKKSDWQIIEISLAKYKTESDVRIVWHALGSYINSYPILDNVVVGPAPTCAKAKNLSVKELTLKDVTLTWALEEGKGAAAKNYKITILNAEKEVVYTTTTAVTPVEGVYTYKCELAENKQFDYATYTYTIQGICGEDDEAAVAENNFTVKCANPTNLKVDGIGLEEAKISWEVDATTGIVSSNFYLTVVDVKESDTILLDQPVEGLSYEFVSGAEVGLWSGSLYKVIVKTSCSAEVQSGAIETTFATECESYALEDLKIDEMTETALSPCWTIVGEPYFGTYGGVYMQLHDDEKLISPAINYESNDLEIYVNCTNSIRDKGFEYGIADDETLSGYVELGKVQIPTSYSRNIIVINTAGVANTFGTAKEKVFVIKADNTLTIYSIDIHKKPCCPRMERVSAAALSATEVEVSWTGTATSYDVILTDTIAKSTKTVNVTTNPCTITELNAQTTYKVEVKANCDGCAGPSTLSIPTFVRTKCSIAEVATFVESFEGSTLPECWSASETNKWTIKESFSTSSYYGDVDFTSKAADGSKCLYMPGSNPTPTYIVSQGFNVETAGQYDVSFAVYRFDKLESYHSDPTLGGEVIRILANNRPDTVGAKEIAVINPFYKFAPVEKAKGWYTYDFNIPELTGPVYLIVEGRAASNKIYFDKIEVKVAPKCRKVSDIKLGEPTTTSVPLTWTAAEGQNKWLVSYEVKAGDVVVKSATDTVATATTFTINDLASSTSYTITGSIKTDCGDENGQSEAVAFDLTFATECDAIALPLNESFENEMFPPVCWQTARTLGTAGQWQRTTSSSYVHEGKGAAELVDKYDGNVTILVTPQLVVPNEGQYRVSYWLYRHDSYSSKEGEGIRVWVNSKPNLDGATELGYMNSSINFDSPKGKTGYQQITYDFDVANIEGGFKYVIFEGINKYGQAVRIDDIFVGVKPDVEPIKEFNVNNVTVNSATVTVADEAITAFDIVYGAPGFDPTTVAEENIIKVTGREGQITGLDADADYEIYVRARNVEKGKVSEWSAKSVTIHTLCNAEAVTKETQFVENFDSFEVGAKAFGCWAMTGSASISIKDKFEYTIRYQDANDNNNWKDSLALYTPVSGERMLFSDNKSDNIWLVRGLELEAGKNYSISASVRDCYGSNEATISFAVGTTTDIATATKVLDKQVITKLAKEWDRAVGYFTAEKAGTYYVAFNTKGYNVLVDDVTIKVEDIVPPMVSITELTGESVTFDLAAAGADYWEMYYATDEFNTNEIESSAVTRVTTEPYTLTGLNSNTTYYYAFRSVKGETKTAWTKVASFKTQCSVNLPFVQDFESADCWTVEGQYRAVLSPARSGNSWNFGSGSAVKIISPMVNGNLANCEGSLWAINNYYGESNYSTIVIGVMTDVLDEATYKRVDTIVVTGSVYGENYEPTEEAMAEYTFSLASLAGTEYADAKYVVLEIASYSNVFVDDFAVRQGKADVTLTAENGTVTGNGKYDIGAEVTLTATPNEGYHFVKWSDGVTEATRTIVVTEDTTLAAEFAINVYTVTLTAENGTVTGANEYNHGAEATLTATPNEGYHFVKWSDGVTEATRTIVVTKDTTLAAEFAINVYTVTLTAENGTVTGANEYNHGAEATLTATPNEGYHFVKWSDGVTEATRTIVVTKDTTLAAEFAINVYTVTLTAENGTVTGANEYNHGAEATLTATPNEGYHFVKWSDGVTEATRTIVVKENITLTAEFAINVYTVTLTAENGTVTGANEYNHGAEATLTATPNEGYHFVKWSDGVTEATRTIVVKENITLTAEFAINVYTITLTAENGTVTGEGEYDHGEEATLTATPNEGYIFVKWSDGVTEATRTIVVTENITLEAIFERAKPVDLDNTDSKQLTVYTNGQTLCVEGANAAYYVLDMSGKVMYYGESTVITLPSGMYLVVFNNETHKIVVK